MPPRYRSAAETAARALALRDGKPFPFEPIQRIRPRVARQPKPIIMPPVPLTRREAVIAETVEYLKRRFK